MPSVFRFSEFELDCRSCELRKRGRTLRVQQQPFRLLAALVAASGQLVTREQLRDRIWGRETYVDFDRAINKAVNRLRQLLGDDVAHPRFIETLPKRGYRFVANVADSSSRQPNDAGARETYLKARYFWNKRTPVDLHRSIEHFRRTIERTPDFALAWTGLADAYVMIGIFGLQPPREVFVPAKAAADRALALDDALAEAHTVLADIQKCYDWNWDGAEHSYRRAIALDPTYAVAHQWYAGLLAILGRHDEAWTEIETARRCEPLSVAITVFVSYVALLAGRYEAAVAAANQALELDTNAALTHDLLGRAYAKLGETHKAIVSFERALHLGGSVPLIEGYRGYAYARAGARTKAEQILAQLRQRRLTHYVSPIDMALVCVGLTDTDGAVAALEEAYRDRAARMVTVGDPFFSELRLDTRYRELLSRLGLPAQL
jgi:DNA-binding winged helix-turn-helix (wHTH) protein/Flp pilus assembly protein TadD